MTPTPSAPPPVERLFCAHLQHEGIGSVYERVVLSRMFRRLLARHEYSSVLELGCAITRGYDNVTFLAAGVPATVADDPVEPIESAWALPLRPAFSSRASAPRADLVWSFASAQMTPSIVREMVPFARKHVLVFVPNVVNPGTPIHLAYHALTGTPCRHAERGSVAIRTKVGLRRLLQTAGLRVVVSGYVDAPPIPDIAFSLRELRETIGWAPRLGANGQHGADPDALWRRVQQMTAFERSQLVAPLKWLVGHHIFALGAVPE